MICHVLVPVDVAARSPPGIGTPLWLTRRLVCTVIASFWASDALMVKAYPPPDVEHVADVQTAGARLQFIIQDSGTKTNTPGSFPLTSCG